MQENHVVAIKNKLYDNSALEVSTQRSSFMGAGAAAMATTSQIRPGAEGQELSIQGGLGGSQQSTKRQYRTDSASKPYQIRKPPPPRNGSVYTSNPNVRFAKPEMRGPHGDTFSQNFKAYHGVVPQSLKKDHSFTAGYATAAERYGGPGQPMSSLTSGNLPPFMNEMDFTGS